MRELLNLIERGGAIYVVGTLLGLAMILFVPPKIGAVIIVLGVVVAALLVLVWAFSTFLTMFLK